MPVGGRVSGAAGGTARDGGVLAGGAGRGRRPAGEAEPAVEPTLARRRRGELGSPRAPMFAIQRSRILAATVAAVDEHGFAETSVASIVTRSRVSRRTFYEMFANRDECLAAVLEEAVARVRVELAQAGLGGLVWCERLRVGLWRILAFLEREPALARVCVVQALGGGAAVLGLRERLFVELAGVVDGGRFESARGEECAPLTAEGLVGAAFMIVYARLLAGADELLTGLLGELMGLIVLPYLGPGAARRERARPVPPAPPGSLERCVVEPAPVGDPLQGVRMRLTYRTARVLEGVWEYPGASNRQVADRAGIGDPGQVSKLLRRLERLGLLENRGLGHAQGEPNEWRLTAKGALIVEGIRSHSLRWREAA
jgi:AcrR family transcriptional regulator/DNA-binding MarR family transcriptional regulator